MSTNRSFELDNSGKAILILDYKSEGEKPDNPGYSINGTFNEEIFDFTISRAILQSDGKNCTYQIAIPLQSEGRVFGNFINITLSAVNSLTDNSGSLIIYDSSKIIVGDVLIVNSYGEFALELFPYCFQGSASITGTRIKSYLQFTITNDTIVEKGNIDLNFTIGLIGEVTYSIFLFDENDTAFALQKTTIDENHFNVSSAIDIKNGLNLFTVELVIYSDELWVTDFNVTFLNSFIEISPAVSGFGFDNLVIPFFNWPAHPVVGAMLLIIWLVPYSVLKFREWKKIPDEIEINYLDDEDAYNIFDPEGLTADDDGDDIDDSFESIEEDF